MTETVTNTYAGWKAPAADGQLLIWPEAPDLLEQTRANQRRLEACQRVRFQGLPLRELRRRARAWIGHDSDRPLLATGHQTELHHPGVWVKNAVIHHAAERLGGQAYHLAVDTDEPKHLHLRWPGAVEPITDDAELTSARWAGLLKPPTPGHVGYLLDRIESAARDWPFQPCLPEVLRSMRRRLMDAADLSSLLIDAAHELDWSLGLRQHVIMASPLWGSDAFLIYAHHLLARADELAGHYNAALDQYRIDLRIKTPGRPMPDLTIEGDELEAPFWLDDLAEGTRRRAHVQRIDGRWTLRLTDGQVFGFDPAREADDAAAALGRFLRQNRHRISPRALTLTMFMRLLVADNFIHGIGGGRYDQVLDRIIARCFGVAPPHFAVATATLHFPTAAGRQRVCLPCLKHEGHRLRHAILGEEKRRLVEAIAAAPRGSVDRRRLFHTMHRKLAENQSHPRLEAWSQRWQQALAQDAEDRLLFDRELFYALQPRDRLQSLIARCAEAFV